MGIFSGKTDFVLSSFQLPEKLDFWAIADMVKMIVNTISDIKTSAFFIMIIFSQIQKYVKCSIFYRNIIVRIKLCQGFEKNGVSVKKCSFVEIFYKIIL